MAPENYFQSTLLAEPSLSPAALREEKELACCCCFAVEDSQPERPEGQCQEEMSFQGFLGWAQQWISSRHCPSPPSQNHK